MTMRYWDCRRSAYLLSRDEQPELYHQSNKTHGESPMRKCENAGQEIAARYWTNELPEQHEGAHLMDYETP